MSQPTFTAPDLDTFCMDDALGLTVTGQHLEPERAVLQCRVREDDPWCRSCGGEGVVKGIVLRNLAHVPLGCQRCQLWVRVRRYRCPVGLRVWRQDTSDCAESRAMFSRHAVLWALKS